MTTWLYRHLMVIREALQHSINLEKKLCKLYYTVLKQYANHEISYGNFVIQTDGSVCYKNTLLFYL